MVRGYIIGGFASLKQFYIPLRYLLNKRGLDTELMHPGPLGLNIWPLAVFEQNALATLSKSKEKFYVIGHSLGGIQAVRLAELYPKRVEKIFAIGSPLLGSPWQVYEDGIRSLLDVPKEEFDRFRNEAVPRFADRIVTIASPRDIMAPIDKCSVPGAKNFVVDTGEEFLSTSHLVIPYLTTSIKIIVSELGQKE